MGQRIERMRSCLCIAVVVLFFLKTFGIMDIPWWAVCAPIWIPLAAMFVIAFLVVIFW